MATFPRRSSFPATNAASTFPRQAVVVTKEGFLSKRQRGRNSTDYKNLRFQRRYCVLSPSIFEYYENEKKVKESQDPNGKYFIEDVKIVEKVPCATFGKRFCFQVGSEKEVLYFLASSEESQQLWINAFVEVAFELRRNTRFPFYHIGAFGLTKKNCWSCCSEDDKAAKGCEGRISITVEIEEDKVSTSKMNTGSKSESDNSTDHLTARHYSLESGFGASPANSRRGTTISDNDVEITEPRISRVSSHFRDSGVPTVITEEEDQLADLESLIYTCKSMMESDGNLSYTTTVMFRGKDSIVSATNTGKVIVASSHDNNPSKKILFDANSKETDSISLWGKYIAIASTNIRILDMDDSKEAQCGKNQETHQLVAFGPDGSLFTADREGNFVSMWSKPNDWMDVNYASKPVCTFKLAEDCDSILSMSVSPHRKHPWLAVVVSHGNASGSEYSVHICNYINKHSTHWTNKSAGPYLQLAFTHDGQHLYIAQGATLSCLDLNKWDKVITKCIFNKDEIITSLASSPVRYQLAVGLNTGEVRCFYGIPSERAVLHSIDDKMDNGAVTSLSFRRDGMQLAIAYNDGTVQVWKGSKLPKDPLIVRKQRLSLTSKGLTYHSDDDGYTIKIPEGAIKEKTTVVLHHGVVPYSPHGPFDFKEGTRPVSTILHLSPEPLQTEFLKPIEITLQHFIACKTPEDCKRLFFSKAQHHNFRVSNNQKIYRFDQVDDGNLIPSVCNSKHKCHTSLFNAATLQTKHCCYICIQEFVSEEDTNNACFSLHQIVPRHRFGINFEVCYCLSYLLDTCKRAVDEQFPNEDYVKRRKPIQFEDHEDILNIQISTKKLPRNWNVRLVGNDQIAKKEVCFWEDADILSNIEELCKGHSYPPRITLRVTSGDYVREGLFLPVSFTGINGLFDSVNNNFQLELTMPQTEYPSPSYANNATLREQLQDRLYQDANSVSCERLATNLCRLSRRCPYLIGNSHVVTLAKEKINFFNSIARKNESNFSANFKILTDALEIADTVNLQYTDTIQEAMKISLEDTRRDKASQRYSVPRPPDEIDQDDVEDSTLH